MLAATHDTIGRIRAEGGHMELTPRASEGATPSELVSADAPEPDLDSLRVDRDGLIWLGDQELSEGQLKVLLRSQGLMIPEPTRATYDTTTEGHTGWSFVRTRKWAAFLAIAGASVVAAVVIVVLSLHAVIWDFERGDADASASELHIIIGTLLYLVTGLVMCGYAFREKFDYVNRLDPRLWVRELHRMRRAAGRPLTDAEIEDWIIDSHDAAVAQAAARREAVQQRLEAAAAGPGVAGAASAAPESR